MPAGDRYVEVPSGRFEDFLRGKGFERTVRRGEVVYLRRHHRDSRYVVAVYTTISDGAARARPIGKDAIKVSAFMFVDPADPIRTRGIAKCQRVFRTGTVEGVLERVYMRMREAYAVCNQRIGSGGGLGSPGEHRR